MNADDTKLETWICRRRSGTEEMDAITNSVMERIRGGRAKAEGEARASLLAFFPKPAVAVLCLLLGVAKIWITLRLAF